ncbi:hypothetical protein DPEC_G00026990 [Dallia pectoralis]|uniref:Uncharacterized protein n=1 Tax=Dallia pectoralis TaxID=75939 RepID=A0ACC2HHQ3_DALPE|nr:hypothetical protein DPEC_G00026990 [Dallia pectoralis]
MYGRSCGCWKKGKCKDAYGQSGRLGSEKDEANAILLLRRRIWSETQRTFRGKQGHSERNETGRSVLLGSNSGPVSHVHLMKSRSRLLSPPETYRRGEKH